jgi:hypothetical protein
MKFWIARDKDNQLWFYVGDKPPIKSNPFRSLDVKIYIQSSPAYENPLRLEENHPIGKNVTFEGGPVEVILTTMPEFTKMTETLFSQRRKIEELMKIDN